MTKIKITNCNVFYLNGKIRKNQNVTKYIFRKLKEDTTEKELLYYYQTRYSWNTMTTYFIATNTSKLTIN